MDEGLLDVVEAQQRLESLGHHVTSTARTPPLWMACLDYPYLRGLGALTPSLSGGPQEKKPRTAQKRALWAVRLQAFVMLPLVALRRAR